MSDPIERFGKTLLEQQLGLCGEWRKANPDAVVLSVLHWQKEVRDFYGPAPLSDGAWESLRDWWAKFPPVP
jgi:hypothetical protein